MRIIERENGNVVKDGRSYSFVDLFTLLLCQSVQGICILRGPVALRGWGVRSLLVLLGAFGGSKISRSRGA